MNIKELKEQQRVRKFRKVKEVVGEIVLSLAVAIVCVSSLGAFLVLWGIAFGS